MAGQAPLPAASRKPGLGAPQRAKAGGQALVVGHWWWKMGIKNLEKVRNDEVKMFGDVWLMRMVTVGDSQSWLPVTG